MILAVPIMIDHQHQTILLCAAGISTKGGKALSKLSCLEASPPNG